MTIVKDSVAKLAVAFVAIATIFTTFAPAMAQESTEDLQATINSLLAQVADLQGQLGTSSGDSSSSMSCNFTTDLSSGSTGAEVKMLQQFLNADADTRVAAAGSVGSAGMETEYYGPATAAAVSKFQVKYRAEILSPAGLVNPTGYFGPASRTKANSLCGGMMDGDEGDEDDGDDTDSDNGDLQGEGTLETFEVEDASDDEVQEGSEDSEIAEITVEATDGDIELDRMTFVINDGGVANTEDEPWEVFDTLSLWVDGDMVAEFDAADEDAYLDEDAGEFRFSGLELVLMEDEEVEIIVAATVQDDVDSAGSATLADWVLTGTEVRYFDADGVAEDDDTTDELPSGSASFVIVEEGDGEELKFSLGDNNPDATDIIVDEDDTTDGVTIMEYTIEAEEGDIELNTLFVNVVTSATTTNIVDDIYLVIDGEEFDDENVTGATTNKTYEFDIDGDVVIDMDEEVTVEVVVDFESQDGNYANGSTIMAQVTSTERDLTDAEGADDLGTGDFTGTAIGEDHTLVAEGIVLPVDGFTGTADTIGDNDNIGEYTLEFEVTAVEGDFYITDNVSTSSAVTDGVRYTIDPSAGGAATAVLESTGDEDTAGVFTVQEGETETFTLTVTFDPVAAGSFRVQLEEVWYSANTNGTTGAEMYVPTPAQDFRTASKAINAN